MILSPQTPVKIKLIESAGENALSWGVTMGDPQNPPVCCLHGFLGSGEDWLRIAKKLSEQFFCILPDLPGHGMNTSLSLDDPLHFDTLNKGLRTLLDTLGIQRTHLLGYSLGGRAALYFAIHCPERVASLMLESASAGIVTPDERRARAKEDDLRAETILVEGVETFVEHWYALPLFRSLTHDPNLRAEIIARRKTNHPDWIAKVIRELSPGRQPPVWDQLSRLEMPVLLAVGAWDEKYVRFGERMAAQLPHAQLEIVPDAGHTVHLDQPDRLISILRDFLSLVQ